jgi:hypothetical protein
MVVGSFDIFLPIMLRERKGYENTHPASIGAALGLAGS